MDYETARLIVKYGKRPSRKIRNIWARNRRFDKKLKRRFEEMRK